MLEKEKMKAGEPKLPEKKIDRIDHEENAKSRLKILENFDKFERIDLDKIDPKLKEVEDQDPPSLKI